MASKRWKKELVTIQNHNGNQDYTLVVDMISFSRVDHGNGIISEVGSGFIRCRGQQYIGGFLTPIYAGSQNEIWYAPVTYLDGEWHFDYSRNRLGQYQYVTAESGTGKLFGELEAFAEENAITAI